MFRSAAATFAPHDVPQCLGSRLGRSRAAVLETREVARMSDRVGSNRGTLQRAEHHLVGGIRRLGYSATASARCRRYPRYLYRRGRSRRQLVPSAWLAGAFTHEPSRAPGGRPCHVWHAIAMWRPDPSRMNHDFAASHSWCELRGCEHVKILYVKMSVL